MVRDIQQQQLNTETIDPVNHKAIFAEPTHLLISVLTFLIFIQLKQTHRIDSSSNKRCI